MPIKRDIFSCNESFNALKLSQEIELKQITKGELNCKEKKKCSNSEHESHKSSSPRRGGTGNGIGVSRRHSSNPQWSNLTAQCTYPLHFPQIYRELGAPQCGVWSPQCWTLDIIGLNTVLWRRRGRYFVVPRGEADAIWRTWGLTFGLSKMMNNTSGILIDNLLITFGLSKMINTTVMWSSSTISSSLLDCQRCLKCCLIIQFCL